MRNKDAHYLVGVASDVWQQVNEHDHGERFARKNSSMGKAMPLFLHLVSCDHRQKQSHPHP